MPHLLVAAFLASAAFAKPAPSSGPALEVFLYGEKPGLADPVPLPGEKALRLHLPRNGFATIAVRLPEEAAKMVPLEAVGLLDAKFAGEPTTVRAYALGVQAVDKSSFRNGAPSVKEVAELVVPNEWLRRPGFHIPEKRVPKRPLYLFEIHSPENAGVGDFQARLHFRRGENDFDIPLQLRVHKYRLPKKFRLKTSFGFAPYGALVKHFGKWADKEVELNDTYLAIAAEHRVDLHKFYVKFAKAGAPDAGTDMLGGSEKTSFLKLWDRARSSSLTSYGFSASTTDLPVPEDEKNKPTEAFWKALESSVIQHDLLDHSFVYFVDEPEAKTFPKIKQELKQIRQWAPQLTFLGTTTYRKELEGSFNLWVPNLVQWDKPGFATPAQYLERREKHGEHYWIYTSCSAHGCGPAVDENVADLVTDRPAAYHRAYAWSAFFTRAEGLLYYNTVEGYGHGDLSPWHDPFLFHGNGEGNLFYPCTQRICGVDGVNVVPSLRWKSIRDGLEDAEILDAGERAGLPVREWARVAFRGVRDFSRNTAEFEKVKVRVLEALDGDKADKGGQGGSKSAAPKKNGD